MSLKDKTAVVTGGGSGIGRACSLQLARDGAAVAVWGRSADNVAETVRLIEAEGGRAAAYVGDASARTDIDRILERIRAELGPVLVLVNNAGVSDLTPFQEITQEALEQILHINLVGPFILTQAAITDMIAAGWGRIINITSSSAQTGARGRAHYSSSKGGLVALTKTLALEFVGQGITVNNIPPGFIDTPMMRTAGRDFDAAAAASPMKRSGRPEDIAAACSYLASQGASYITGQTIGVNGGRVIC